MSDLRAALDERWRLFRDEALRRIPEGPHRVATVFDEHRRFIEAAALAASATDEGDREEPHESECGHIHCRQRAASATDEGPPILTAEELVILPRMRFDLKRFDAFRREDVAVLLDIIDRLDRRLRASPAVPEALDVEDLRARIETNLRVTMRNVTGATDFYAGKAAAFRVVLHMLDDRPPESPFHCAKPALRSESGREPNDIASRLAASATDEGPTAMPWLIRFTCCGRADGVAARATWDEADALRQSYIAVPNHRRSAIIEDALAARPAVPEALDDE